MMKGKTRASRLIQALTVGCVVMLTSAVWAGLVINYEVDGTGKWDPDLRRTLAAPMRTEKGLHRFDLPPKVKGEDGDLKSQPDKMVIKSDGPMCRISLPWIVILLDQKAQVRITLEEKDKSYLRSTGDGVRAAMQVSRRSHGMKEGDELVKFVATGKEKKIGEYETKEYVAIVPHGKIVAWVTDKPGSETTWAKIRDAIHQEFADGWGADMKSLPGLPVRWLMDEPGRETVPGKPLTKTQPGTRTFTMVSINEEPVAKSEFEVPAGYKAMFNGADLPAPSASRTNSKERTRK